MKILLPLAALLTAGMFQAPANPPMKMGLWEAKGTTKTRQPDGTDKISNRVIRTCITREDWLSRFGPTFKDGCKTNEAWTKDRYSFDVGCSGKPKIATFSVQFETMETQHGTLDVFASPHDGSPMSVHDEFSSHWISSECGDVSPDHPVLVR